jgi:SAM-dependent MidA family methyltransferase
MTDMDGNRALIDVLRQKMARHGRITFRDFMNDLLYHPDFGYYTAGKGAGAEDRDYYTTPDQGSFYGEAMVHLMTAYLGDRSGGGKVRIIEFGAGSGRLARDILMGLRSKWPSVFDRCEYIVVEVPGRRMAPGVDIPDAFAEKITYSPGPLEKEPGGAPVFILANELIDAFPVHRVVLTGGGLEEVFVRWEGERFGETTGPPSTKDLTAYIEANGIDPLPGHAFEINLEAGKWIDAVSDLADRAAMILCDYGYETDELFRRMPDGSLTCYFRHRAHHDPYIHIGEQDLTTHVDFSALRRAGEAAGFKTDAYLSQADLFLACGFAENYQAIEREAVGEIEKFQKRSALKQLIHPEGMGGMFKFLVLSKGWEGNPFDRLKKNSFTGGW